jgi:N4-(beta-N-acetylglucosaminyl)-L-asparaginase
VERIVKRNPEKSKTIQVGFVALNRKGEYGGYSLQKGFSYSVQTNSLQKVFPARSYYP